MKITYLKKPLFTFCMLQLCFISCVKSNEAINKANELIKSPRGYWTTEDSKLGQVGWKINGNDFKKCTIALDSKMADESGALTIDGNRIKYLYKDSQHTATYHTDDDTITEDDGLLKFKYVRADDIKVRELNSKGCHL